MQYIDQMGRYCSREEALKDGMIRDGFTVRVPMLLVDNAPSHNLADAEQVFADSPEGRAAVARAEMIHNLNARDFGPADAASAVKAAMAERQAATDSAPKWAREADVADGRRAAARSQYLARLSAPTR